jgi:hypothetical protein
VAEALAWLLEELIKWLRGFLWKERRSTEGNVLSLVKTSANLCALEGWMATEGWLRGVAL